MVCFLDEHGACGIYSVSARCCLESGIDSCGVEGSCLHGSGVMGGRWIGSGGLGAVDSVKGGGRVASASDLIQRFYDGSLAWVND